MEEKIVKKSGVKVQGAPKPSKNGCNKKSVCKAGKPNCQKPIDVTKAPKINLSELENPKDILSKPIDVTRAPKINLSKLDNSKKISSTKIKSRKELEESTFIIDEHSL